MLGVDIDRDLRVAQLTHHGVKVRNPKSIDHECSALPMDFYLAISGDQKLAVNSVPHLRAPGSSARIAARSRR